MNLCVYGYMAEFTVGGGSVPVYDICRDSHHITGIEYLYGLAFFLIIPFA